MNKVLAILAIALAAVTVLIYTPAFAEVTSKDLASRMSTLDELRGRATVKKSPTHWVEEVSSFYKRANNICSSVYQGDRTGYLNCMDNQRAVRDLQTDQRLGLGICGPFNDCANYGKE